MLRSLYTSSGGRAKLTPFSSHLISSAPCGASLTVRWPKKPIDSVQHANSQEIKWVTFSSSSSSYNGQAIRTLRHSMLRHGQHHLHALNPSIIAMLATDRCWSGHSPPRKHTITARQLVTTSCRFGKPTDALTAKTCGSWPGCVTWTCLYNEPATIGSIVECRALPPTPGCYPNSRNRQRTWWGWWLNPAGCTCEGFG